MSCTKLRRNDGNRPTRFRKGDGESRILAVLLNRNPRHRSSLAAESVNFRCMPQPSLHEQDHCTRTIKDTGYVTQIALREVGVVGVRLVQQIELIRLRTSATTIPDRTSEVLGGIRTGLLCEDLFKGFRPLHTVVQTFKFPEILEKVKEGRVSVLGVGFIHGTLLVDQRVGGDPRRDQKGRNATDRISLSLYTR